MRRLTRLSKILSGALASIFILSVLINHSVAAEPISANAAQGIEISPALVELNATNGGTYNIVLNVKNITASTLSYTSSTDDFAAADESGSPKVILDDQLPVTASIKTWVNMDAEFILQPRQTKTITANIVVPTDAEPGGHYGILRFSGAAPIMEDSGVSLSTSAGVLVLIRVAGDINEKASLASFYSAQNDKQSWFFENSPIDFVTRIQNEGNIHIKPAGNIEVRDVFNNLVSMVPVNEDKSNILPDSIRKFSGQLSQNWLFGHYTASLALGYGTTGQAITATISFWVIPYKIILIGLFALITIIFIFVRLIKVYNKHIIKKAKAEELNKNQ
ncbi:MAG: hypothetical protein WCP03_04545 [Candidatus Saccharibacteria bacterium]